jgi:hypothetical protein
MFNKIKNWLKHNKLLIINFSSVYIGLMAFIVIPYLIYNNIMQWDSVGHLYSSWYIKEYLFPAPVGWNPNFFTGFPQGTFYPPLFHYIVAILSFITPLKFAFKILVALSVLATPISFYYFAKAYTNSRQISSTAMLGMTMLLIAPLIFSNSNNNIGGTFVSTFNIGLVTNALALPLYFFYLGSLRKKFLKNKFILPTILLALIIHTHILTALAAVLYLIIFGLFHIKEKKHFYFFIKHIILTGTLCTWWAIPFLVFLPYSETVKAVIMLGTGGFILIFSGLIFSMIIFMRQMKKNTTLMTMFLVIVIGALVLNFLNIKIHTYRFVIFALLLVPLFFAQIVPKKYLISLTVLFLILAGWGINSKWVDVRGPKKIDITFLEENKSLDRSLILANDIDKKTPHYFQHTLPQEEGIVGIKGLFVESSRNSKYLMSLERMLDPESFAWGVNSFNPLRLPAEKIKKLIQIHLKTFGIKNVITDKKQMGLKNYPSETLFTYSDNSPAWILEDKVNKIPIWNRNNYFANTPNNLFYISRKFGELQFIAYEPIKVVSNDMILITPEETFYVHPYDDAFLKINLHFSENTPIINNPYALNNLKENLDNIDLSKKQKEVIEQNVYLLEEDLYKINAQYAKTKYPEASSINIEKLWEKTIRIDEQKIINQTKEKDFYVHPIPDNDIIEILDYSPKNISREWDKAIWNWFISSQADKILVYKNEPFPDTIPSVAKIKNVQTSNTQDKINFTIDSENPVPILIKISYFPKWKAKADGSGIPIYRSSPNLMLIYAKGDIELNYTTQWYEYLGIGLSIISLLWISYILTNNKKISIFTKK